MIDYDTSDLIAHMGSELRFNSRRAIARHAAIERNQMAHIGNFGLMHQQWASSSVSDKAAMAQTVADIEFAEDLGFDSFMLGEHHFPKGDFPGRIAYPEYVIAHAAARSQRIRLGTGVKVLALEKQWRVVESMLTLDLLSDGRVFFGVGAGGDEPAIFLPEVFTPAERRSRFRACLKELLELLRTQGLSQFEQRLGPADVDSEALARRILVAARDTETIQYAAEEGLHFVMGQAEVAAVQAPYIEAYRASTATGETRTVRVVVIAPTDEEAVRRAWASYKVYAGADPLSNRYYVEALQRGVFATPEPVDQSDALSRHGYVVGNPRTVATQLAEYQASVGADRLDLMVHMPELSPDHVRESMRLFAEEVAPALPDQLASPLWNLPQPTHG